MMLYTRKGDKGDTYFFGSKERASKSSCQTEALGTLDELNSLLGVCKSKAEISKKRSRKNNKQKGISISKILEDVQQNLFIIQAAVAGADKKIAVRKIKYIEGIIQTIESELPPIKTFFLPGATELSAFIDYARTVARRAEREVVRFSETEKEVEPEILQYLNRLSSLLYALVRFVNFKSGVKEVTPTYE